MQADAPLRARIPVYLLTGYLGSGKTTLLAAWLQEKELAESALIINEIGEVGLDQHVLRGVTESAALLANACICCTGLPGLEQALAELFWARLQRKIAAFTHVIIETTGLADPTPIAALFNTDDLLQERYRLAGIVTTLSATSGLRILAKHNEAVSQVNTANLIIITKTDVVATADVAALEVAVRRLNPAAGLVTSAWASLHAQKMLALLAKHPRAEALEVNAVHHDAHDNLDLEHGHRHNKAHEGAHHGARTVFFPLPNPLKRQAFWTQLEHWIRKHEASLLRIKGVIQINDGALVTVQWSLGDRQADMAPFSTSAESALTLRTGLTVIAHQDFELDTKQLNVAGENTDVNSIVMRSQQA